MILILQIALGILLGFLLIVFLPLVLRVIGVLAALAAIAVFILAAVAALFLLYDSGHLKELAGVIVMFVTGAIIIGIGRVAWEGVEATSTGQKFTYAIQFAVFFCVALFVFLAGVALVGIGLYEGSTGATGIGSAVTMAIIGSVLTAGSGYVILGLLFGLRERLKGQKSFAPAHREI